MGSDLFDKFARALSRGESRRSLMASLGGFAFVAVSALDETEAKRRNARKKRKRRRRKKHDQSPPAPPGACLRPTDDLQAAIDAASPGGTLVLCNGTWLVSSTFVINKDLTLRGAGPGTTILDGGNACRVLSVGVGPDGTANSVVAVTLEALEITQGSSPGFAGGIFGYCALTLKNVVLSSNRSDNGGALAVFNRLTLKEGSRVMGNQAAVFGGGIYGGILSLEDGSSVTDNVAADAGGGIANYDNLTLGPGCSIARNTARVGGGVYNWGSQGTVILEAGSSVVGNTARDDGGGLFNEYGSIALEPGSSVASNLAGRAGGGIFNSNMGTLSILETTSVIDNVPSNCAGDMIPDTCVG